jgi:hypothetical protein
MRRLALVVVVAVALLVAAAADAAGPPLGAEFSGTGLVAGAARYVALPTSTSAIGSGTFVAAIHTSNGAVISSTTLDGLFAFPRLGYDNGLEGLSADGSTLVLAETPIAKQASSRFVALETGTLQQAQEIDLQGDFSFDALSPNGRFLFLIQHMPSADASHYVVRAYDRDRSKLLPGRIADRTQRGWVMQGYPISRTATADGRIVYTLYQNPGGVPFVHALDTVSRTAHCVGFPLEADQAILGDLRLVLRDGGRKLGLDWRSGERYLAIDTQTWAISTPGGGFPWSILGASLAGAAALVVLVVLVAFVLRPRRRRRLAPA